MRQGAFCLLLALGILGLFLGMGGQGGLGRGELRPEIRLKLYDQAIAHYEKARTFHAAGQAGEALSSLRKATKIVTAFPEAYELARRIHGELGNQKEAQEAEKLFREYGGDRGASLFKLRERIVQDIELRRKSAPSPDVKPIPSFLLSGCLAGILLFGMIYEYRRLSRKPEENPEVKGIFLEKFPEEEEELSPSWFFKLCVLLFPAPCLFSLLVFLGFRTYSDLAPVFFLSWAVVAVAIYLIFFADFSDVGGFRRPSGAG